MAERRAGKLGALPVTRDSRTLKLSRYISHLGTPPKARDWLTVVPDDGWGVLLNDQLGCCVESAAGHFQQLWTAADTGVEQLVTDRQILSAYERIAGYVPGDPSTDQGTDPLDALKFWRKYGICGHKISAFVEVNVTKPDEVKWAIERFGGLYAAIAFPASAMGQFDAGEPWTIVPGARSEGGHMIMVGGYDDYRLTCISWGNRQSMTWEFWHKYRSAGFAVLSSQWTGANGRSPTGVDLAQLKADLAALPGVQ
jgi:hypothetical protein